MYVCELGAVVFVVVNWCRVQVRAIVAEKQKRASDLCTQFEQTINEDVSECILARSFFLSLFQAFQPLTQEGVGRLATVVCPVAACGGRSLSLNSRVK
jgi:hypothetical protein